MDVSNAQTTVTQRTVLVDTADRFLSVDIVTRLEFNALLTEIVERRIESIQLVIIAEGQTKRFKFDSQAELTDVANTLAGLVHVQLPPQEEGGEAGSGSSLLVDRYVGPRWGR